MQFAAGSWGGIIEGEAVRGAGTIAFLDFTFSHAPDTSTGSANGASAFIGFWETVLVAAVLGYIFSWTASVGTRLFLGMRLIADRQSPSVIWQPGTIGGTTITPGDVVCGDDDGVVLVERAEADWALERSLTRLDEEERTRVRLLAGELGIDLYGLRAKLAELGVECIDSLDQPDNKHPV